MHSATLACCTVLLCHFLHCGGGHTVVHHVSSTCTCYASLLQSHTQAMHSLRSYQKESVTKTEKPSMERHPMDVDDGGATHSEVNVQELEQAKNAGWRSLFYFTSKSHVFSLMLALLLSLASGIIIPALAVFLGKIFDYFTVFGAGKISGSNLISKVSVYGIALAGLGSASGLLNAGYFMFWLIFGELQAKSVRDKLFDGMLEKDMAWYDMRKDGIDTLMSRLQS